jgi:hypothetical protein
LARAGRVCAPCAGCRRQEEERSQRGKVLVWVHLRCSFAGLEGEKRGRRRAE